jgi:hypothetical protein
MNPTEQSADKKLTLAQEFQLWFRQTPRVWLIVIALLLLIGPLRGILGTVFSITLVLAILCFVLLVLPALLGALAGSATGAVVRVARRIRTRR